MKNFKIILGVITIVSFILFGCSNASNQNSAKQSASDKSISSNSDKSVDSGTEAATSSNDCEAFIKGYDKFADKYIVMMKKMKANPSDPSLMSEYTGVLTEVSVWIDKAKNCAGDLKFRDRLLEIQKKIDKASAELQ